MCMAYHEKPEIHHVGAMEPAAYMIPNLRAGDERETSERFQLLSGKWDFAYYPSEQEVDWVSILSGADFETQIKMPVPGCWQTNGFDQAQYITSPYPFLFDPPHVPADNPVGIYRTVFSCEARQETSYLYVEGADSCLYASLNGHVLGYAEGPHNTACFDVTGILGEQNVLTVCVLKWCSGSYLDDQDKIRLSGIFRDVYILHRPRTHLRDFFAVPDESGVTLTCEVASPAGMLHASLFDAEGVCAGEMHMPAGHSVCMRLDVKKPRLWSAETPYLYTLRMELEGEWVEQRVGLRTVAIHDGVFQVNGVPVKLLGVNRHDMHPDTGYAVTMADMRCDLELMKRSNINCVRTAHYPNDPRFYELCSEMGLYVIDEADMETHGCHYIGDSDWLMNDPAYESAILDREKRLVERDKNFSCVILWSMGNESGWGKSLEKASRWIKGRDPSRLLHMESAFSDQRRKPVRDSYHEVGPELVDMIAVMYPSYAFMDELLSYEEEHRPLLLTEYCHAMGNSLGGMKEYAQRIFAHPRVMGGCIWEWADHALRASGGRFLYGGDFGEKKHHNNICADGLVNPDREPHSALGELRQAYAPVIASECCGGRLMIENRWSFLSTQGVVIALTHLVNGRVYRETCIPCPTIAPLSSGTADIPLPGADIPGEEVMLVRFMRGGTEISRAHFTLKPGRFAPQPGHTPLGMTLRGGMIRGIHAFGSVLAQDVHPVIWRAPLDNDRGVRLKWQGAEGENINVPCMTVRSSVKTDGETCTRFALGGMSYRPAVEGEIRFAQGDGRALLIAQRVCVRADYPSWLPRYGLCWRLPKALCHVSFYGLGPGESYEDKQLASYPGWFAYDALYARDNYLRPQESGSHAGTYLVCLTDAEGKGLAFYSGEPFSFCVQAHTLDQLTAAKHPDELPEPEALYLYTDIRMSGIGSASVGPELPGEYRINPGDMLEQMLFVAAIDLAQEDPFGLLGS